MLDKVWDWIVYTGLPTVWIYHAFIGNIFLNTSAEDATGLERAGNIALTPLQYLFAGNQAHLDSDHYEIIQRFSYEDDFFWVKTLGAVAILPSSTSCGVLLKGLSYLLPSTREHHEKIKIARNNTQVESKIKYYKSLGLNMKDFRKGKLLEKTSHKRQPGAENCMPVEKQAFREVIHILQEENIPYWVDCGTCLGAYRYGGVIPWDHDIDLTIMQPDFDNTRNALKRLDKSKYHFFDWSGRDRPKSYLMLYIKETRTLIDIYVCAIDREKQEIYTILSNEGSIFLPEAWKIRERRCCVPVSFSTIFPLKKANFDGIIVPVPNKTKKYLQSKYGKNIEPAKIFNESTGIYEKDLTHPYWLLENAH